MFKPCISTIHGGYVGPSSVVNSIPVNDLSLALAGHVGEKMRYKQERNDLINKEADAKKSRQRGRRR